MNDNLNAPLSFAEMAELGAFLESSACSDDALDLAEAHGFITAIVIAPTMLGPSQWQPMVFGDNCDFETKDQADKIIGLTLRLYNQISDELSQGDFKPYGLTDPDTLASWCRGFLQGARTDAAWTEDNLAVMMLFPFATLAGEMDLTGEEDDEGKIIEDPTQHLEDYRARLHRFVEDTYSYWLKRRAEARRPVVRTQPKVGRNDPCSCGSGKKFKKCCGAVQ